ncbi:hypothetical protein FRZ61_12730 [Hypericibacter adhaerens]|jgi:uncharacterized protein (DUF983 family)|uniref:Zinc-finger protein n=1 Tax=Hypericibacter adhaerens TaxID=2602016 RepID=A0A5J6MUK7_9PROT|nr:hypothetical protein FRZ61_12730 [Hypericibacter adhaerens]
MTPSIAEPTATPAAGDWSQFPPVPLWTALKRGFTRRCPRCGQGSLFKGYLTMADQCSHCGLAFEPYRSDDVPAYFTILIVGHIVVPGLLALEKTVHPEYWVQMAIWMPVTLFGTLALLPFIKGAVIGTIWRSKQDK